MSEYTRIAERARGQCLHEWRPITAWHENKKVCIGHICRRCLKRIAVAL